MFDEIKTSLLEQNIYIEGVEGAALAFMVYEILKNFHCPSILLIPSQKELDGLERDLCFFFGEGDERTRIRSFRAYDINPLSGVSPNPQIIKERIECLFSLSYMENPIVLTTVEALASFTLPKKDLVSAVEAVEVGQELDLGEFARKLTELGYERVGLVEGYGEYSIRGAVVDLFPPLFTRPIRIEAWADRIESIREFNPTTQRSELEIKEAWILPAKEVLRKDKNKLRAKGLGRLPHIHGHELTFAGEEAWLKHFYEHLDTLWDYAREDTILCLLDPHRHQGIYLKTLEKLPRDRDKYKELSSHSGNPFPILEEPLLWERHLEFVNRFKRVCFWPPGLSPKDGILVHRPKISELPRDLELRLSGSNRVSLAPFAEKAEFWKKGGARVMITVRTETQAKRIQDILENYGVLVDGQLDQWELYGIAPGIYICLGRLSSGFAFPEEGLYVVSEDQIFGGKREYDRRKRPDVSIGVLLSEIRSGDFVVHQEHGIGRYLGLTRLHVGGMEGEFVVIQYANDDKLYIPADRAGVLQKYVGTEGVEPKLDQMGGKSWEIAKRKARSSAWKIAKELVQLYALREQRKGIAYSPPDRLFREFEATFPYEETPDQLKAIEEVIADMLDEKPMDRLVCGDVGFGKTEVALRAAFKAVADGKQVAILVPTTLLAEQHFRTFKERMEPFGVKVEGLSRFKSSKEQAEILARLRSGDVDVIIGTHRLLQPDVSFKNLGLLVVDEEQRFGVKQKELINGFRSTVDVISMTATPIPRTLQMSLLGIRDLSIIETPPENRLSIQTTISVYDQDLIRDAIREEMKRNGQVFYVYNQVQDIDKAREELQGLVPEAKIAIAHGQMKGKELERTMERFLRGEVDVLLCTTIIESGLDIPTVNTIIIDGVERMGLAQIYQLRGRVGRANQKAYAYLLIREPQKITKDGEKRLKALAEFSHLGAGIGLALHDLKIRGGGNILGFKQSGHIELVGYETYLQMVQEAVMELRGEEFVQEIDPEIKVELKAYIPTEYISDPDTRLSIYRRLSGLKDQEELERMKKELQDRFGPIPELVRDLLWIMELRIVLKRLRCSKMEISGDWVHLQFESFKAAADFCRKLQGIKKMRYNVIHETKVRFLLKDWRQDKTKLVSLLTPLP